MNGQISLLNAISEKESQTSNVERQTLPKSSNAFALLMAGNPSNKSVEKHTAGADKGKEAVASADQDSSDKKTKERDSKSVKKALDDVLPQLSLKGTPLTVSKSSSTPVVSTSTDEATSAQPSSDTSDGTDATDTNVLANVPMQTDGNATLPSTSSVTADSASDVSDVEGEASGASSAQNVATVASSIAASTPLTASSVDEESSPSDDKRANVKTVGVENATTNQNKVTGTDVKLAEATSPVQVPADNAKAESSVAPNAAPLATDMKTVEDVSKTAASAPVVQEVKDVDKSSTTVQPSTVDSQKVNANPNPTVTAQVATTTTPATDKSQVAVASQYTGNQVASNANPAANTTSTASSVTTSSSDSSAGQQSGGQQSFSQNGQGNQSSQSNLLNQFVQSQMQAHQSAVQQAAVKHFNDLSMNAGSTTADSSKLLGSLGFDNKAQLPPGMQGIVYSLRSPQWSQALGQRMVYMANNKVQEAKITLNPEKLGPVQIKLHLDKNQQVHVAMSAHHHMTKETMEAAIPKLREMFDSAGIDLGSIDVNQDSQFEAQQQNNEQGSQQGNAFGQSLSDESEHESTPIIVKQTDGLIDYYA
ncbi:flagellar hook-length control protein FliK [Hydrogenovibrio sp. JE_KL2]|uniref:flagellar hook-length control protein FliK n=1 Tax=Hydrogenovibrio sp. JE_KL2 TaxID=2651188 RepID=UPI001562C8C8|nr:flagellar hook-length control protein FliK [Hydrogenovibrio sp. JE_KL2]